MAINGDLARNDPALSRVARNVIWFEEPGEALQNEERFLAYLMTYGNLEDLLTAFNYFSDESFMAALRNAPPGIFDIRSWTFWNLHYFRAVPPLPVRRLPDLRIS
jgi:hypothetical protein